MKLDFISNILFIRMIGSLLEKILCTFIDIKFFNVLSFLSILEYFSMPML